MTRAQPWAELMTHRLLTVAHAMPWWAAIPASLGPTSYICRMLLQYKLASKALDKAPSRDIAAVMAAISNPGPGPHLRAPRKQQRQPRADRTGVL
jgi:hypothetical protein